MKKIILAIASMILITGCSDLTTVKERQEPVKESYNVVINNEEIKMSEKDYNKLKDLLKDLEYDEEPCDCVYEYKIVIDNKEYLYYESDEYIEYDSNTSAISKEDKNTLDNLIDLYYNHITDDFEETYTLDYGRKLFLSYNPKNNDSTLGESIFEKNITINEVIRKLKLEESYRDGGSRLYKYTKDKTIFGNREFYMLVCNNDSVKDIYISATKDNLTNKCSIKYDDIDGISMKIKDKTLTKTGATVIITDETEEEYTYGEDYMIEMFTGGTWKELETEIDFDVNDKGYKVDKNNTLELKINWSNTYGELSKGKYRIIKTTLLPGEGKVHYITVEFTI